MPSDSSRGRRLALFMFMFILFDMYVTNTLTLSQRTYQMICFSLISIHANFRHQSIGGFSFRRLVCLFGCCSNVFLSFFFNQCRKQWGDMIVQTFKKQF